jgi:hypothetical protein
MLAIFQCSMIFLAWGCRWLLRVGAQLPAEWLDKLLLVAQWRFPSFPARLLSIVAWSTATLNHRPQQEWLMCFEEQVRREEVVRGRARTMTWCAESQRCVSTQRTTQRTVVGAAVQTGNSVGFEGTFRAPGSAPRLGRSAAQHPVASVTRLNICRSHYHLNPHACAAPITPT